MRAANTVPSARAAEAVFTNAFLGISLHPLYPDLITTLDAFGDDLPEGTTAAVVSPPHFIPSTSFVAARYPRALALHVLSLVPPSRAPSERTIKASDTDPAVGPPQISPPNSNAVDMAKAGATKEGFMGMPAVNMTMTMPSVAMPNMSMPNMSMDVRKWGWLQFGKGGNKEKEKKKPEPEPAQTPPQEGEGEPPSLVEALAKPKVSEEEIDADGQGNITAGMGINAAVADGGVVRSHSGMSTTPNVDTVSLEDAMSSDARSVSASIRSASERECTDHKSEEVGAPPAEDNATEPEPSEAAGEGEKEEEVPPSPSVSVNGDTSPTASQVSLPPAPQLPTPVREFLTRNVHLPDGGDSLITRRRRLLYLRVSQVIHPSA